MTTLNINLKPCICPPPGPRGPFVVSGHVPGCLGGQPVLIPCPIPRTVAFKVVLGECPSHPHENGTCEPMPSEPRRCVYGEHPLRSVSVTCAIGGETWAASEVVDTGVYDLPDPQAALAACRARWALVKALVLGERPTTMDLPSCGADDSHRFTIFVQRNVVFAALADMARAEEAAYQQQAALDRLFPGAVMNDLPERHAGLRVDRPSAHILAAYVSHLIATVGDL